MAKTITAPVEAFVLRTKGRARKRRRARRAGSGEMNTILSAVSDSQEDEEGVSIVCSPNPFQCHEDENDSESADETHHAEGIPTLLTSNTLGLCLHTSHDRWLQPLSIARQHAAIYRRPTCAHGANAFGPKTQSSGFSRPSSQATKAPKPFQSVPRARRERAQWLRPRPQ